MFELGKHLVYGATPVTILLFVMYSSGQWSSRDLPMRGALRGRILAIKHFRWVGLLAVGTGLILMAASA